MNLAWKSVCVVAARAIAPMAASALSLLPCAPLPLPTLGGAPVAMAQGRAAASLPWAQLKNPIYDSPTLSIKDVAVAEENGTFALFFSAFDEDTGRLRARVMGVTTRDFQTFSPPFLTLSGEEDGWLGMASPDITFANGQWVLTFNSWGDKRGKQNQLFYMTSPSLTRWGQPRPLATNLTRGKRSIDVALAFDGGAIVAIWKDNQTPRMASGTTLDGAFSNLAAPTFRAEDGDTRSSFENYQFIRDNGAWLLLATHMKDGHKPYLFKRTPGAGVNAFTRWEAGRALNVAREEDWNSGDRANAAFLLDRRAQDGFSYLFYAGSPKGTTDEFGGRGHNRIFVSRSTDLVRFMRAGR